MRQQEEDSFSLLNSSIFIVYQNPGENTSSCLSMYCSFYRLLLLLQTLFPVSVQFVSILQTSWSQEFDYHGNIIISEERKIYYCEDAGLSGC